MKIIVLFITCTGFIALINGSNDEQRRTRRIRVQHQRRRHATRRSGQSSANPNAVSQQTGTAAEEVEPLQRQMQELALYGQQNIHGNVGTLQQGSVAEQMHMAEMQRQMQVLGINSQNNNHVYALRNPNAPPPLPLEHFYNIGTGSIISVMIQGKDYVEVGLLEGSSSDYWPAWAFGREPILPIGPEHAFITVFDPDQRVLPNRNKNTFAVRTLEYRPYMYYQQVRLNPTSEVFIKNGNHVYYATLLPVTPNMINHPSIVSVIEQYGLDSYRSLHGTLTVWDTRHALPHWVLQSRPIWL